MARTRGGLGTQLRDALKDAGLVRKHSMARPPDRINGSEAALSPPPAQPGKGTPGNQGRGVGQQSARVTFSVRPRGPEFERPSKSAWIGAGRPVSSPPASLPTGRHAPSSARTTPGPGAPAEAVPPVHLRKVDDFHPNPLLLPARGVEAVRIRPAHDGISRQLVKERRAEVDEADLIIGLDFGTSCVKAVVRDHQADRAYAVRFMDSVENPFLLPSRVYCSDGVFSLDGGADVRSDLKLRLLGCAAPSPVDEFNEACAFLALVIRHCRGWILDEYAPNYRKTRINWSLNLGLPARSYEEAGLVALFRRLAWAAANAAADDSTEITRDLCDLYRQLSKEVFELGGDRALENAEFGLEDVHVVPEIAAQIFGFVNRAKWDWKQRPMMMLVDIGAGTVDAAFFSFTRIVNGERRFAFFANDVQPNGTMNLHRERVQWLRAAAVAGKADEEVGDYLESIMYPTDRLAALPESVSDYLRGYEIVRAAQVEDVDRRFYRTRYYRQVSECTQSARRRGGISDSQMQDVPCFLTGGGSRMSLYRQVIDDINSNGRNITLQGISLGVPREGFVSPGLREGEFDRLSVAFGLSLHGAGGRPLGKVIRTIDVPPAGDAQQVDWRSNYIDKDMC